MTKQTEMFPPLAPCLQNSNPAPSYLHLPPCSMASGFRTDTEPGNTFDTCISSDTLSNSWCSHSEIKFIPFRGSDPHCVWARQWWGSGTYVRAHACARLWDQSAMKAISYKTAALRRAIHGRVGCTRSSLTTTAAAAAAAGVKQMSGPVIADKQKLHFQ